MVELNAKTYQCNPFGLPLHPSLVVCIKKLLGIVCNHASAQGAERRRIRYICECTGATVNGALLDGRGMMLVARSCTEDD